MSFLFGKQGSFEQVPGDIQGLRGGTADYLQRQLDFLSGGEPSQFFIENFLGPTRKLFAQNRESALAQGKEQAGNLTGSGLAETLGGVVNRSLSQEDALLAQMLMSERGNILQALLGFGTAGVGPPQQFYTPGLLDSLFQGAGAAAPFFAGGAASPNAAAQSAIGRQIPFLGVSP